MSVLIKGMEMPTTCRDCGLSTFTDFDSMPFCNVTMDDICFNDWETKRCDNCPLVSVPPHGRLIEAEAAKEFLKPIDSLFCYEPEWTWGELYESNCAAIDKLPTIIPAEEGNG